MQLRAQYRYALADVQRELQQLADAVDQMLARALRAFRDNDAGAARDTVRADDDIDERRYALEERVLSVIAAQQPLAADLRFLLAVVQVATELERVGDYAHGIAMLVIRNAGLPPQPVLPDVLTLGVLVRRMLRRSIAALIARDADAAGRLEQDDDQADTMFATILSLTQEVLAKQVGHPRRALYALFVAHNLERSADRAVNIAERATFVASGPVGTAAAQP